MWSVGPWSHLSVHGHDKLSDLEMWMYGVRDSILGYLMLLYLGRSNRLPHVVNRELLQMCIDYGKEDYGLIPLTIYSDHGTETVGAYSYFNVMRDYYVPQDVKPGDTLI
jgi:hypothetical protein